jgi:hypothetical protein
VTEHDPLDGFFEEAAPPDPPADLVARILAAAADPERLRQAYWSAVGDTARQALIASAAALLISAGLAWIAIDRTVQTPMASRPEAAPAAGQQVVEVADAETTSDPLQLAITTEPIERQLAGGYMLLGEER